MKRFLKTVTLVLCLTMLLGLVPSAMAEVDKSQTLIIYTNSGSNGRAEWLMERAKQDGYNVEVVFAGAGEITNRIVAEKNNQIADLLFGLNTMEYVKLKKEDLLLQYTPVWADQVDKTLADSEGYYYPIVIQPLFLVYNTDAYPEGTAPKDYTDLLAPEFKDKYTVLKLSGGTSKTIISSILVRYRDDAGEYGVSQEGWDVMKGFIQNGHIEAEGDDVFGAIMSGERPVAETWGSNFIQQSQTLNTDKLAFVVPEVGVPYVVEQVAVFKNSKKTDLAIDFINWFGSSAIQAEWSAKFGSTPAQPEALATASQQVQDMMAAVTPQQIDWNFVVEHIEQWMEKIELEFVE